MTGLWVGDTIENATSLLADIYLRGRYDSVDYGNREVLRDLLASPLTAGGQCSAALCACRNLEASTGLTKGSEP